MNAPTEGTENQTVSACVADEAPGVSSSAADGQQTQAPRSQATNMSKTDRSKVMVEGLREAVVRVDPVALDRSTSMKARTLRWATVTPLGMPVLPEVKSR